MINIFLRQCENVGSVNNTERPWWFSKERCFLNLLSTKDNETEITVMFDGLTIPVFLETDKVKIVNIINGGSETKTFVAVLDHVLKQDFKDDEIIYFLEDDYVHLPNWQRIMKDGLLNIKADYVTLYDHFDKYTNVYQNLSSQVLCSLTHWRTTPSTTNTYACLFKTLKRDADIHYKYSQINERVSRDHEKFLELWKNGRTLISPIPGLSTHCANGLLSPLVDWAHIT